MQETSKHPTEEKPRSVSLLNQSATILTIILTLLQIMKVGMEIRNDLKVPSSTPTEVVQEVPKTSLDVGQFE